MEPERDDDHRADVKRTLLSWSSGKDSAWSLHLVRQQSEYEIVGLLTTFNQAANRVAMHAVRRSRVEAQAKEAGIPLWDVDLPWRCSNTVCGCRDHALLSVQRVVRTPSSTFRATASGTNKFRGCSRRASLGASRRKQGHSTFLPPPRTVFVCP
jgi:hypothetical protein